MNYRVIWRRRITDGLAAVQFLALELGRDAGAVTRAIAEVGRRLGTNPADEGESREGAERAMTAGPLTVTYEVFEAARVVMIYEATYYPRRRL